MIGLLGIIVKIKVTCLKDSEGLKSDPIETVKKLREKCGDNVQFLIASIGEDPDLESLNAFLEASNSPLPHPSHIAGREQISERINFLANFTGQRFKFADFSMILEIGTHKKTFQNLNIVYDDLHRFHYEIDNKDLPKQGGETATFLCQYSNHGEKDDRGHQHAIKCPITYCQPQQKDLLADADEATSGSISQLLQKIVADKEAFSRMLLIRPEETKAKVIKLRKYFNELRQLQLNALETVSNKDSEEFLTVMSNANDMLRSLASAIVYGETLIDAMRTDGKQPKLSNALTSNVTMTTGLSSQNFQREYMKGNRTASSDKALLKGLAKADFEIDEKDGRIVLKVEGYNKCKCLDSNLDLVEAVNSLEDNRQGIAYADGDPSKREILIIRSHELYELEELFKIKFDRISLDAKGLEEIRQLSIKTLKVPSKDDDKVNFDLAVFANSYLLKFTNGRTIPASPLGNFINSGLCGNARAEIVFLCCNIIAKECFCFVGFPLR